MISEEEGRRDGEARRRPVNPLAALTLVLVFPRRTFERLTLKPNWIVPLLFVIAAVVAKSLLSLQSGVLDDVLQAEAMRTNVDVEMVRGGAPIAFVASGVIGVPVVMLLQSLFFMAVGRTFGASTSFKLSLSTVAYASVPLGVGALAAAALFPLTHSPDLGLDLARFVDPVSHPFLWGVARELGVIQVWFYILIAIAAAPVLGLRKRRARLAVLTFVVVHVLIMSWMGMSEARSQEDPMAGWTDVPAGNVVLHFQKDVEPAVIRRATEGSAAALDRARAVVGAVPERIDCYFYPSVGQKERLTGNPMHAHSVSWANAVHAAVEGEFEVALAREMSKVAAARVLGKMYNPFVADGLALYSGARWRGAPVTSAAAELLEAGEMPALRLLIDPDEYARAEIGAREVAAGAFTAFVIDDIGIGTYRELYSYVSRTKVPLENALERVLRDSVGGVEDRWKAYLADDSSTD